MSQPEGNMNRQLRRHKGPLIGMIAVVVFATLALLWWLGWEIDQAEAPHGAAVEIDGRTGEPTDLPPTPLEAEGPPLTDPDEMRTGPETGGADPGREE